VSMAPCLNITDHHPAPWPMPMPLSISAPYSLDKFVPHKSIFIIG
jgi:hypothetical protein